MLIICIVYSSCAQAQYWFGPRAGGQFTDFVYDDKAYEKDSFNVKSDYGYHLGGMVIYQATDKYAVEAGLYYEKIDHKVTNKAGNSEAYSFQKNHFVSLPLALRWNFGREPTFFYVSGGPKISFWMFGNGAIFLDELEESRTLEGPIEYRLRFGEGNGGRLDERSIYVANRILYGLHIGGGVYFNLRDGGRLLFDGRFNFGHSNMGFNDNPDFTFEGYIEDFQYRNNTLSASVAYLFEYDIQLQKKGMSTNKQSNKRGKKLKR